MALQNEEMATEMVRERKMGQTQVKEETNKSKVKVRDRDRVDQRQIEERHNRVFHQTVPVTH